MNGRLVLACVLMLAPVSAAAQNSVLGVRGLGFPARVSSASSRSLAGADQLVDPLSAANPATVGLLARATAGVTVSGSFRSYDLGGAAISGLRETRFPVLAAGGRLSSRVGFGLRLAAYAERTWDVTGTDTVLVAGAPVEVTDRLRSLGSIADASAALAVRPVRQVAVGIGLHAITGSTRLDARRVFSDSTFREFRDSAQTAHEGYGVDVGVVVVPVAGVQLALAYRSDGTLTSDVDSVPQPDVPLPSTLAGGLNVAPLPGLRLAANVVYRTWADAAAVYAADTDTRDVWEVSGGLALDGDVGPPLPLRVGVRYAQLPFVPAGTPPARELDIAAGTTFRFAQGRGLIDVAIERVLRDGGGVTERAWQVTLGMSVRP